MIQTVGLVPLPVATNVASVETPFGKTFKFTVTEKIYYIKSELNCESKNGLCLITYMKC